MAGVCLTPKFRVWTGAPLLGLGVLAGTVGAAVADEQPTAVEEIVVTAQRRSQSMQDVPISLSAFDQRFLERSGADELSDVMDFTPGLSGSDQGVTATVYAIRGLSSNNEGIGADTTVGVFLDGGYLARPGSVNVAFIDVKRVEVLKGPQGTLFGRNTSAGAIHVISNEPAPDFSLNARLTGANRHNFVGELTTNLPLVEDRLFFRASLLRKSRDGLYKNVNLPGEELERWDRWAARAALRFLPTDQIDWTLRALWERTRNRGPAYDSIDPTLAARTGAVVDPQDGFIGSESPQPENRDLFNLNNRIEWNVNDEIQLTSITMYNRYFADGIFDVDGSSILVLRLDYGGTLANSVSQEFRATGEFERWNWLLGVSYFYEDVSDDTTLVYSDEEVLEALARVGIVLCSFPQIFCNDEVRERVLENSKVRSLGIYGDATWQALDDLRLTAGLRYSFDKKWFHYDAPPAGSFTSFLLQQTDPNAGANLFGFSTDGVEFTSQSWSEFTPRFVIDYRWDTLLDEAGLAGVLDGAMTYASVSRGFKAGGFEPSDFELEFGPETVWAYEAGFKTTWWGGRARWNASAYYNDYKGLQINIVENGRLLTTNAGNAQTYGVEMELSLLPINALSLFAAVAYTVAEYDEYETDSGDFSGNKLSYVPVWAFDGVAEYTQPLGRWGEAYVRTALSWKSRSYFSRENTRQFSQGAFTTVDLRLGWIFGDGRFELATFVDNVTDKEYLEDGFDTDGFIPAVLPGPPRRYGASILVRWGA